MSYSHRRSLGSAKASTMRAVSLPSYDRPHSTASRLVYKALGAAAVSADAIPADLGQIQTSDGYTYQVTPEDMLWLARAVQCEGGDHAATIWTYAQRQAYYRRTSSLSSLILAHSQPVNPAWADPTTSDCQQYPDRCQPASIAARQVCASRTWNQINADVRTKVVQWAQAQLPNPVPKSVDFADPTVSASFLRNNPGSAVILRSGNWYIAVSGTLNWKSGYVTMKLGGQVMGASFSGMINAAPIVGVALVGAGALFAVGAFLYSRKKRAAA